MSPPPRPTGSTTEQRFQALVEGFAGTPGVVLPHATGGRGFGSDALRVNGSIFAMLVRGSLVVKLPSERVTALIAAGVGVSFDAGKGRPMREWVTVVTADDAVWRSLALEAHRFVGHEGRKRPRR